MCPAMEPLAEAAAKRIQELEVEDDDESTSVDISISAKPSAASNNTEEDGLVYKVAWDSSTSKNSKFQSTSLDKRTLATAPGKHSQALQYKDDGNGYFKAGNFIEALKCYIAGFKVCKEARNKETSSTSTCTKDLAAVLLSNAAAAALHLDRFQDAIDYSQQAHSLRPSWTKPLHRLAEAHLALGNYPAAAGACVTGEALCNSNSQGHTEFTPLFDRIAVEAASKGSLAGFTGRQLEVRSAGDDAWLGRPAPHVPALDGPLNEDSALPSDDLSAVTTAAAPAVPGLLSASTGTNTGTGTNIQQQSTIAAAAAAASNQSLSARNDSLATWHYSDSLTGVRKQRTSYRSIKEAVAAAKDGDRILLRRGTHNGMGESIDLNKRISIQGEGSLGETVIDQRANCPTFRILRGGCVVRNIDLDQTGFREAMLVTGTSNAVAPLIDKCIIKCSGDNAIDVSGHAAPLFRGCIITSKKTGLRASESACPRLHACVLEKCGEQGIKAMEHAAVEAVQCAITDCEEDGAVACGSSSITLLECTIEGNKGPGVDCSDNAHALIRGGRIGGNVGGVWVWDLSTASLEGVRVEGGPAHVVLADGGGKPVATNCAFKGTVHATDAAWEGLFNHGNSFSDPDKPTDFPAEEGPFRFVPNPYTRKQ